jgi:hypothetical protein
MTTHGDAVARYVLAGSDEDLKRLLRISTLLTATTRTALATVDVRPGCRALEQTAAASAVRAGSPRRARSR